MSNLDSNQLFASLRLVILGPGVVIVGALLLADGDRTLGGVSVALGLVVLVVSVYRLRRYQQSVQRERSHDDGP